MNKKDRYIGIAKDNTLSNHFSLCFLLWNRMIKIVRFNRGKWKCYYYNKTAFNFEVNEQKILTFKWFAGVVLGVKNNIN